MSEAINRAGEASKGAGEASDGGVHSTTLRADVDLAALGDNLRTLRLRLPPRTAVWVVVKADAYGHGAVAVARHLQARAVDGLVVSDVAAGVALRRAGIERPILVLDPPAPHEPNAVSALAAHGLSATVHTSEDAVLVSRQAERAGRTVGVHVRVDTGFAGFGAPRHRVAELVSQVSRLPGLRLDGLFTHLSGPYHGDSAIAAQELGLFATALALVDAMGLRPPLVHALSSPGLEDAALVAAAARLGCTMVRPGSSLYGIRMRPGEDGFPFAPVMSVAARIARVARMRAGSRVAYSGATVFRSLRAAVLPLGFHDLPHLQRAVAADVLIHGHRAPLLGRAFMNTLLVDVTAIPAARAGDTAVLLGRQHGAAIGAEDIAGQAGVPPSAIPLLGPRVVRVYRGGDVTGAGGAATPEPDSKDEGTPSCPI